MAVDPLVHGYVANEETYPDKALVIEEGSKGQWVYVILEGSAKVKRATPKGMVTVSTLKQGEVFGHMNLLGMGTGEGIRTATVTADGPVRIGVLDAERLVRDYEMISPQLKGLIRSLTLRLNETTSRLCDLTVELK